MRSFQKKSQHLVKVKKGPVFDTICIQAVATHIYVYGQESPELISLFILVSFFKFRDTSIFWVKLIVQ